MAVTFRRGPKSLVRELQRRGFRVESVYSMDGAPDRSLQICLRNGVVVNWDRDSQSVWADGPWEKSRKVEAYLEKRASESRRGRSRRARVRAIVFSLAVAAAIAVTLGTLYWGKIQTYLHPTAAPQPSAVISGLPVAGE